MSPPPPPPPPCLTSGVLIVLFILETVIGLSASPEQIDIQDAIDRIKDCYSTTEKNEFNRCLFDYWKEVRPLLAAGIPNLKVPKLDPLYINEMEISENGLVVQGKATFRNLTVTGLSAYQPKNLAVDVRARTITVQVHIAEMHVAGLYDVDGTALFLPVKGDGIFRMKLTRVDGKAVAHVERDDASTKVDGARLANTDIDFDVGHISSRLENLLGGHEVGEAINNLINDNAREILDDVKPSIASKLGVAINQILAGAIKELPADAFILPEAIRR